MSVGPSMRASSRERSLPQHAQHARLLRFAGVGLAHRPLLVELLPHHLDDDGGHGDIHHPHGLADAHLDADRDHGFVGRQQVQQLRLGLHALDGEIDVGDGFPGFPQILQDDAEQAVQQPLLDFGDVALDGGRALPVPPSSISRMGKTSAGIQFQHAVAIVGAEAERNDAGGRRQAVQELRVRELLHADQVDRQIGAQIGGEAGNQVAHEGIVQQVDGAHLRFGDAVRAAEIEFDRGSFAFAVLHILKYGVDFLLRKLSAQLCGLL